jgi:hypothetical protein
MSNRQFDLAQLREEQEREHAIEQHRERLAVQYEAVIVDGVPCCAECLEELPDHRIGVGICVPCLSRMERRGRR